MWFVRKLIFDLSFAFFPLLQFGHPFLSLSLSLPLRLTPLLFPHILPTLSSPPLPSFLPPSQPPTPNPPIPHIPHTPTTTLSHPLQPPFFLEIIILTSPKLPELQVQDYERRDTESDIENLRLDQGDHIYVHI